MGTATLSIVLALVAQCSPIPVCGPTYQVVCCRKPARCCQRVVCCCRVAPVCVPVQQAPAAQPAPTAAIPRAEAAPAIPSLSPAELAKRGRELLTARNYAAAIESFEQAMRLEPSLKDEHGKEAAKAYFFHGLDAYRQRDFDRSIADFSKTLELDPSLAVAHRNRGLAALNKIRLQPAAAAGVPGLLSDHQVRFNELYRSAIADFEYVTQADPKDAQSYQLLAFLLSSSPDRQLRDGAKAVEMATRACELSDFQNWEQLVVLATAKAETGDFAEGVKWARRSVELAPTHEKTNCETILAFLERQSTIP